MTCTASSLNASSTCFQQLSADEREAAIVWYLWQLAITDGYTSDLDTMLSDGAIFAQESPAMLQAMEVTIAYNAALAAGASVTGTLDEAVEGIKCLKNTDQKIIRALKVLLECQMANAVS